MTSVTEAKKCKLLTDEEIKQKAKEVYKTTDNKETKSLCNEIITAIDSSFSNINALMNAINLVLFLGILTVDLLVIVISVLALAIATMPFNLIRSLLKGQQRFLRGRLKPDDNIKNYYAAVDNILAADFIEEIQLESFLPIDLSFLNVVTEAPKTEDVDPRDDNEDEDDNPNNLTEDIEQEEADATNEEDDVPEDYTEDVDTGDTEPNDNEEQPEENPEPQEDTPEEDTATDFTADAVAEEQPPEEGEVDANVDNAETDEGDTTGDETEEIPEEEPTDDTAGEDTGDTDEPMDFTDDADGADAGGEDVPEEGDATGNEETPDETIDDTAENGEDNNKLENSIVKNYNLMLDFSTLYKSTEGVLRYLQTVHYGTTIQNSIVERCISNITKVKEQVKDYIENGFGKNYTSNLYYYTVYVQCLKINLEMLRKVGKLKEDSKQ